MPSLEEILRRIFVHQERGSNQDEYLNIDDAGHARFDVASYVASDEGKERVQDIARAIKAEQEADSKEEAGNG